MMINFTLESLLISSILSAVLLSLVLILRWMFKESLSIKILMFVWTLALVRLLMPFTINSPVMLGDLFKSSPSTEIMPYEAPEYPSPTLIPNSAEIETEYTQPITLNEEITYETPSRLDYFEHSVRSFFGNSNGQIILITIWLLGAFTLLAVSLWRIAKFRRLIYANNQCTQKNVLVLISEYKEKLNLEKDISVRECEYINVPVIIGIKAPTLLMPKGFLQSLDKNSLSMVILHEMCHIKSNDILKNNLWLIAKALNWYNPLVYIGYHKFLDDMEKNCDQNVLSYMDSDKKASYFDALLSVIKLAKDSKISASLLCFCRDKSKLRKRVDIMIKNKKPNGKLSVIITLVMITAAFLCFTTACTGDNSLVKDPSYVTIENTVIPMPTVAPTLAPGALETPAPTPTAELNQAGYVDIGSGDMVEKIYDGNNPISEEELRSCDSLEIRNVVSLDFLNDLDNIKEIYVTQIDTVCGDIAVLSTMDNLESVRLGSTGITGDIACLQNLTKLKSVFLGDTDVYGNLSSIENLIYLQSISLFATQVRGDIAVFENMSYLQLIIMDEMAITGDIKSIENCKMLEDIYMGNTSVSGDIAVFADMPYLDWVALEMSDVTGDIAAFADCHHLRVVYLFGTLAEGDLSSLSHLENLYQFDGGPNVTGSLDGEEVNG